MKSQEKKYITDTINEEAKNKKRVIQVEEEVYIVSGIIYNTESCNSNCPTRIKAIKEVGGLKFVPLNEIKRILTDVISGTCKDSLYNAVRSLLTNEKDIENKIIELEKINIKNATERINKLEKKRVELIDSIMLGESEEVLKLLQKFRAEKI